MIVRLAATVIGFAGLVAISGCAVANLFGGMAQNFEYQKLVETHPQYVGLEGKSVAVVVNVDHMTRYEHPGLDLNIAANVAYRIQTNVPDVTLVPAVVVSDWLYRTPNWEAMAYSEIANTLNVDRVVLVDIYEYRLHPPGNQWLWEGVCVANIGIIERDGIDPDSFSDTATIESLFPKVSGVGRDGATEQQIQRGLLTEFVQKTAWLFYFHLEPKYPDKYRALPE